MKGFNRIKLVYYCQLQKQQMESLFGDWERLVTPMDVARQESKWTIQSSTEEKQTDEYPSFKKIVGRKWPANAQVSYNPKQHFLVIKIATSYSLWWIVGAIMIFMTLTWDELLNHSVHGDLLFWGHIFALIFFSAFILEASSVAKGRLKKEVEEALYTEGVFFEEVDPKEAT